MAESNRALSAFEHSNSDPYAWPRPDKRVVRYSLAHHGHRRNASSRALQHAGDEMRIRIGIRMLEGRQAQIFRNPQNLRPVALKIPRYPARHPPRCEGSLRLMAGRVCCRLRAAGRFVAALRASHASRISRDRMSGRIEARTGLRMMPTFPRSPLSFGTAGFPQYGWKAGLSGGAFPGVSRLKSAPDIRRPTAGLRPPFVHLVVDEISRTESGNRPDNDRH